MSDLASLKRVLTSGSDEATIRSALAGFLKAQVPEPTSQFLKEQPFAKKCGEGVDAEECKAIIDQCISGNIADQKKCKAVLEDLVKNHSRQKILADGIKGMDGRMARQVCGTLGINFDLPNAPDAWMRDLLSRDPKAAKAINDNAPLMDIIKSFAAAAANPALNSKSLAFSRVKASMSVLPIPVRTPRTYEHKSSENFLMGGGRNVRLVANTYEQYTDSLKRLASMSGGGAELNKTHDEIANIYNSFVYSLQARGKQIDHADHLTIRNEIGKLRTLEEKLSKVVLYITRYNSLLNSSDPEIKKLVANGTLDVDLLQKLNGKYDELKKKHEKKSYGIMSITDAINKVLSAADSVKADVASMKECLGPQCAVAAEAKAALASEGGFRYNASKYDAIDVNPFEGSPRGTPSPTPRARATAPDYAGV